MPRQLSADCLNEIFECLGDEVDEVTLRSCLLVNRLWCEISVRILWINIQNYKTLFACLPNESKEILHENKIIISTPTSKPPLFNYVTFIKNLSGLIGEKVESILMKHQQIGNEKCIIALQEIFKMIMNQTTLKKLDFWIGSSHILNVSNIPFTIYPGAMDCLRNLTELRCYPEAYFEFFYPLSQICHNLQSLDINLGDDIENGLSDLISVQQNLKHLRMRVHNYSNYENLSEIITPLTKLSDNIIKLDINIPLSFIDKFNNLQELVLELHHSDFKILQHVILPDLQVLKFEVDCSYHEHLITFLENNGKRLKEIHLPYNDDSINLAITEFCPNLRFLSTLFKYNELRKLKTILSSFQQLERVKVWCGKGLLNENELLETVVKYSQKKFHELIIHYTYSFRSELFSEELEPVFTMWANRIPQQPLSLIIIDCSTYMKVKKESMEVIENFKKMGVIKKFVIQ